MRPAGCDPLKPAHRFGVSPILTDKVHADPFHRPAGLIKVFLFEMCHILIFLPKFNFNSSTEGTDKVIKTFNSTQANDSHAHLQQLRANLYSKIWLSNSFSVPFIIHIKTNCIPDLLPFVRDYNSGAFERVFIVSVMTLNCFPIFYTSKLFLILSTFSSEYLECKRQLNSIAKTER